MAMNEDYLKKYMDGYYTKNKADYFFLHYRIPGLAFQAHDRVDDPIPKFSAKMFEHMNLVREYSQGSSGQRVFREHSATATIMLRAWFYKNDDENSVYVRDVDLNYYKADTNYVQYNKTQWGNLITFRVICKRKLEGAAKVLKCWVRLFYRQPNGSEKIKTMINPFNLIENQSYIFLGISLFPGDLSSSVNDSIGEGKRARFVGYATSQFLNWDRDGGKFVPIKGTERFQCSANSGDTIFINQTWFWSHENTYNLTSEEKFGHSDFTAMTINFYNGAVDADNFDLNKIIVVENSNHIEVHENNTNEKCSNKIAFEDNKCQSCFNFNEHHQSDLKCQYMANTIKQS